MYQPGVQPIVSVPCKPERDEAPTTLISTLAGWITF